MRQQNHDGRAECFLCSKCRDDETDLGEPESTSIPRPVSDSMLSNVVSASVECASDDSASSRASLNFHEGDARGDAERCFGEA